MEHEDAPTHRRNSLVRFSQSDDANYQAHQQVEKINNDQHRSRDGGPSVLFLPEMSNGGDKTASGSRKNNDHELRQKETASVLFLRMLTLVALTIAATVIAVLTYHFSRSVEITEFKTQCEDSAIKVEEAILTSMKNKINSAKTVSALYTSRFGPNNEWPNATLPDFHEQVLGQLEVAGGVALSYNPFVKEGLEREAFESHAFEHAHYLGAHELIDRSCDACRIVEDGIFRQVDGNIVDDPGSSPESTYHDFLLPIWQVSPIHDNWRWVMFNLHSESHMQRAIDDMLEYQVPTITSLLHLDHEFHLDRHDGIQPSTVLFYPVFDRFELNTNDTNQFLSQPRRKVKGSISIEFTWEDILKRILPSYINGMIVVIESSVSKIIPRQLWTFEIDGEYVRLLGEGDKHDPKYEKYVHLVQVKITQENAEGITGSSDDHLVHYEIKIYPSKIFEEGYLTSRPASVTIIVICIFIFTSAAFLAYDFLLKKRRRLVLAFATKSGRIVDNLFPENVRDRLFDNTIMVKPCSNSDDNTGLAKSSESTNWGEKNMQRKGSFLAAHMKSVLRRNARSVSGASILEGSNNMEIAPIADLFPETSIMFADIVGFTEWSSSHKPEEVFRMLETLFFEFDSLAEEMGIFKLGTIGDCYIAVTGIPDYRPDHAFALCDFAEECRLKMKNVVKELGVLGGMDKLGMRFGIHSGPVTAGVLRGKKSRFELFGDTINTASRMESHGVSDQIQISQETADLLVCSGYDDWIRPRDSLVQAKGKGWLQTYWFDSENRKSEDK